MSKNNGDKNIWKTIIKIIVGIFIFIGIFYLVLALTR